MKQANEAKIIVKSDSKKLGIEILENGSIIYHREEWQSKFCGRECAEEIRRVCANAVIAKFAPTLPGYIRCTNDAKEPGYIMAGTIRPSHNYRDGFDEAGLSVSDNFGYAAAYGYKYCYFISGAVIASGSDGEPVLAIDKNLKRLSPILPVEKFERLHYEKRQAALIESLENFGWTYEHYLIAKSLLSSALPVSFEN